MSVRALVHLMTLLIANCLLHSRRLTSFCQPYMRKLHTLLAAKFAPSQARFYSIVLSIYTIAAQLLSYCHYSTLWLTFSILSFVGARTGEVLGLFGLCVESNTLIRGPLLVHRSNTAGTCTLPPCRASAQISLRVVQVFCACSFRMELGSISSPCPFNATVGLGNLILNLSWYRPSLPSCPFSGQSGGSSQCQPARHFSTFY